MNKIFTTIFFLSISFNFLKAQNITTIAGTGTSGFSGDNGLATSAQIAGPSGVAVDLYGNVYFVDQFNNRIRKIDASGNISTVAGAASGPTTDGGLATATRLIRPIAVAVDINGYIYIAEHDNARVRKVDNSGIISTIAGTGTYGYSGDGGAGTSAQISNPSGVAVDMYGNVYFGDQSNQRIRKIDVSGNISTIAGTGTSGYSGDGGPATSAQVKNPAGVAVDPAGNIYIAEYQGNRIRKIDASGNISTIAGTGVNGFSGDGAIGTSAQVNQPYGVAVDNSGNVYIADYGNSRVRKINTLGIITTVAGTTTSGYAGDGGPATSARLNALFGVALDASNNIYIADQWNHRVRKVTYCFTPTLPVLSATLTTTCSGDNTTLSISSGTLNDATAWNWYSGSCGGTPVGTGPSITVNPSNTTTYYARGEGGCVNGAGCTSILINVNQKPTITVSGRTQICRGESTTLTASGGVSYSWNGDPFSTTTDYTFVSPTDNTLFGVTGKDANNCSNTVSGAVMINELPTFTISGTTTICKGESTTLTAENARATLSYSWAGGPLTADYTVSPTSQTSYTVTATNGNNCSKSQSQIVTVNDLPTVTYDETQNSLCSNGAAITLAAGSPAGGTYSGTAVTGNSFDPATAGSGSFNITYDYTDGNGCHNSDVSTLSVSVCSGTLPGMNEEYSINVFPNPSNGTVNLELSKMEQNLSIEFFNALGKKVFTADIENINTHFELKDLPNGIYEYRITSNTKLLKNGKVVLSK